MKLALPLALALLLVPLVDARPDVRVPCAESSGVFCTVGPCTAGSSWMWPGYALLVTCHDGSGQEVVFVADYTCDGGLNGVGVRVLGYGHDCITARTLLEDALPETHA